VAPNSPLADAKQLGDRCRAQVLPIGEEDDRALAKAQALHRLEDLRLRRSSADPLSFRGPALPLEAAGD